MAEISKRWPPVASLPCRQKKRESPHFPSALHRRQQPRNGGETSRRSQTGRATHEDYATIDAFILRLKNILIVKMLSEATGRHNKGNVIPTQTSACTKLYNPILAKRSSKSLFRRRPVLRRVGGGASWGLRLQCRPRCCRHPLESPLPSWRFALMQPSNRPFLRVYPVSSDVWRLLDE